MSKLHPSSNKVPSHFNGHLPLAYITQRRWQNGTVCMHSEREATWKLALMIFIYL